MGDGVRSDSNGNIIQAFAPTRTVQITATEEWTPTANDRVFAVPSNCTYQLNGTGLAGILNAGDIRGINVGSFIFDTTMVIEVM